MKLKASLALAFGLVAGAAFAQTELVVATVNNGHMIEMQKLSKNFETANPDIKLKWVTLEEGVLRQRVTTDIATKGGQFDVMTIGMYETPIWGKKGWLQELKTDAKYDADDILPAMRNGLSVDGKMYAVRVNPGSPFSAEAPRVLFTVPERVRVGALASGTFDISPDDRRFLLVRDNDWAEMAGTPTLVVVQNFLEELRAKLKE